MQARAKVGFLATEAFSHCSNVSRQIILSASLKMYIGVLVFLSKRYSSSRTANGCEVEINKEQSSSLCEEEVRFADCDLLSLTSIKPI